MAEHCPGKDKCPYVREARQSARERFRQMQYYRDKLLVETARREKTEKMLLTDPLTGAMNRRGLEKAFLEESAKTRRFGRKLFLLFMDIDNFKSFNELHGEATGDLVLQKAVEAIGSGLRRYDTVFRIGGEEFVVLLPELRSLKTACRLAERVRLSVAALEVTPQDGGAPLRVSISVGMARYNKDDTLDSLEAKANRAEQEAKKRGKDRTFVYLGGELLPVEPLMA